MISLREFRAYCEGLVARLPEVKTAVPLTLEANMADRLPGLKEEDCPVLFFLPPSAQGGGYIDAYTEESQCVIFVMAKFTARTQTSVETLERVQPAVEAVKRCLLEDSLMPCHFLKVLPSSLNILPETEFFRDWAGWSIAFKSVSY